MSTPTSSTVPPPIAPTQQQTFWQKWNMFIIVGSVSFVLLIGLVILFIHHHIKANASAIPFPTSGGINVY